MNKRSAIVVAAGTVAAIFAGALAIANPGTPAAVASPSTGKATPRVRVIERTRTIHRQAEPEPGALTTLSAPSSSSSSDDDAQVFAGEDDADEHEDDATEIEQEGGDDDAFEDDAEDD